MQSSSCRRLMIGLCLWWAGAATQAADWPTWRCDAQRGAASAEALPAQLHPQWVRRLPQYEMAWPHESRLHFDASYEPVVMGKMLFVGSAVDGRVCALDTETGEEKWSFYTEGPVRLAPAAWQGRLYVGSDDGFLYCLAADSGKLLWKLRGAPEDRPDYRHLGNNRLISFWPVRGGPVLADGVVYFAAGIWPTHGVFIVAADARSGETLWVNDRGSYLSHVRIDHNALHEAGLSPQGYLLVNGDKLLVPNGRSFPARLDRKTGELLYYVQGYRNGDCRVTTMGKHAFVGTSGVMSVEDGREAGSRWVEAGPNAPNAFDGSKLHLFEGPYLAYKVLPACNARSVLGPEVVYGMDKGTFYAYDLTRPGVSEYEVGRGQHKLKPWRWSLPLLWKAETPQAAANPPSDVLIKAGGRLYGHAGKTLLALDLPAEDSEPKIVWQHAVEGTPSSMLAADGKLLVVTKEGAIHCFGPEKREEVVRHALEEAPLSDRADDSTRAAADILERTGATEGYALVLGLDRGRLVEELLRKSKLRVVAVDADPDKVNALRDRLMAAGLYGARAEVLAGKPFEFLFPPYLANLVVSEAPSAAGLLPDAHAAKLFAVLRPYGGTACLDLGGDVRGALAKAVESAKRPGAKLEEAGGWLLVRREGPLPGSASWTHETADSARSFFSKDHRVKAPLGVLWYGDGADHGFYKSKDYGVGVKPQVVGGRMFAYQIFSRTLHAIDVYTGRLLWKTDVEHFTRYASMDDGVYVAGGDRCLVLDPATGTARKTFRYQVGEGPGPQVSDVRVGSDVIVIAAAHEKVRAIDKGLWDSRVLVALDRGTGEQLWTREAKDRFNNNALAVARGTVFAVDSVSPAESAAEARRGSQSATDVATILALDARTGREKWRATTTNPFQKYSADYWLGLRANDDWLAFADQSGMLLTGRHKEVHAFDAATGDPAWHKKIGGGQPLIVMGDRFINQAGHTYALETGEPISGESLFYRGGCNYAVASEHLLFVRDRCVSYVELDTRKKHYLRNVRSGCSNSLIAADGLLNAPCFSVKCVCNYPIQTSFAMVHMPEVDAWAGTKPQDLSPLRAAGQSAAR